MPAVRKPYFAAINVATAADHTIVAAKSGHSIRVKNYTIIAAGAVNVTWKSNTTALSGAMPLIANSGAAPSAGGDGHILDTADGEALKLTLDAAVQVSGHICYEYVDD